MKGSTRLNFLIAAILVWISGKWLWNNWESVIVSIDLSSEGFRALLSAAITAQVLQTVLYYKNKEHLFYKYITPLIWIIESIRWMYRMADKYLSDPDSKEIITSTGTDLNGNNLRFYVHDSSEEKADNNIELYDTTQKSLVSPEDFKTYYPSYALFDVVDDYTKESIGLAKVFWRDDELVCEIYCKPEFIEKLKLYEEE